MVSPQKNTKAPEATATVQKKDNQPAAAPVRVIRKGPGAKEVIPFEWKLVGESRGLTITLFKAIEREEVEAHLLRLQDDGYYKKLRILDNNAKLTQSASVSRVPIRPGEKAKATKSRPVTAKSALFKTANPRSARPTKSPTPSAKPTKPKSLPKKPPAEKPATGKTVKAAKAAKPAKATKTAKGTQTTKGAKTAKASKAAKATKTTKAPKAAEVKQTAKTPKIAKASKTARPAGTSKATRAKSPKKTPKKSTAAAKSTKKRTTRKR